MLPSKREHRFQKISVSAIHLHSGLKIPFPKLPAGRPNGAQNAPKAPQERSQTLLETHFGRLFFGALRALQGVPPRLFGTTFGWIWHGFGGSDGMFSVNTRTLYAGQVIRFFAPQFAEVITQVRALVLFII